MRSIRKRGNEIILTLVLASVLRVLEARIVWIVVDGFAIMKKAFGKIREVPMRASSPKSLRLFAIFTLMFLIPMIVFLLSHSMRQRAATKPLPSQQAGSNSNSSGNTVTFTPSAIPFSDPEIPNPWRGALYYGSKPPTDWPFVDYYGRWCWGELEPEEGVYDFSKIEALLAEAKAHGGKGGLRIMPVNTSGQTGSCLPGYLRDQIGEPPDWNDLFYLDRVQALLNALSKRYDSDPRFGWIEIGPYGNWGEWNLADLPQYPMTAENKKKLIQMNVQAFPHKRLLIGTDAHFNDGSSFDAMSYTLSLSPKIGLRSDCLGTSDFGGAYKDFPAAPDRWKTAPVVLEYCAGPDYQLAYRQLTQVHAALIGDGAGNIGSFDSLNPSNQRQLITNLKTSGYRFLLDSLTLPSHIAVASSFTVTTRWSNVNVAPAYNPWNVMIQLRNTAGSIVWQEKSALDLQTLLPTRTSGTNTPVTITDTFTLPNNIAEGTYTVSLQIVDPEHYYHPLALAIKGRAADGSYPIGAITVVKN